jgi:gliding motility-associated-like protein
VVAKNTCFGTPVIFADSSKTDGTNPISKWIWKYGDGVIDTLDAAPYQHIYPVAKTYTVVLKLIDAMGCTDTFKLPVLLNVTKVNARFYIADTFACSGMPVKFTCPYWTSGISYSWSFGDGDSSRLQLPAHRYATEGTYAVNLLVTDVNGCQDSSSWVNAVRVLDPKADFTMSDSFKTCPPLVITFTSQSLNTTEERWDFGDSSYSMAPNPSHFYTYPGVYTATLFAKGRGGCISQMQKQITVNGPRGTITYDPLKLCKPFTVNFKAHTNDAVNYVWDFNDGVTVINSDSFITHTYQDSGAFVPKILLIDNIGCKVPVSGKDTIINFFATAGFTFPDTILCNTDSIVFTNTSFTNDSLVTYNWDFGDGTFSNQINPAHQFALPGSYYPSLTVTTRFGCTNQYKSLKPLKAAVSSNVGMQISANGCAPLSVVMSGVVLSADTTTIQWQWSMDNGNNFNLQTPPTQQYIKVGLYTIVMTAVNSNGCIKTISKIVEAYGAPVLSITKDSIICKGQSILLQAGGAVTYSWSPAINLSSINTSSTLANPAALITYNVIGVSSRGCTSVDSVTVTVRQPFKINYSRPAILCAGQTNQLSASGAATYRWSPAAGLNNPNIASPKATPDSTTNYSVIGTDDRGCFNDTGYVSLLVYPIPTVDAGADKTITVGSSVDLIANFSDDVTEVNWTPTGELFRNSESAITVKPKTNTEYTIEVKNIGGCAARDRVNVLVVCNGSNVFLPNLFSPNSDGVNDIFYPRGTGLYKIKILKVFNRWGETVFEKSSFNANDPSSGWDGNYKGVKLNSDTFVFIMELICDNNSILTLNGNVALVR